MKLRLIAFLLVFAIAAFAAGPGQSEQSVSGLGSAGAYTARAEDAGAMFYNPAALVFLDENELTLMGKAFLSKSFYSNLGQTEWESEAEYEGAPELTFNHRLGEKLSIGLSSTLTQKYDLNWDEDDFPVRFSGVGSSHEARENAVGLAFRFSERFSIGATYRQVDMDFEERRRLPRPIPGTTVDGELFYEVTERDAFSGDGSGFSAGLFFQATKKFAIGASYRGAVTLDMDGTRGYTQVTRLNDQRAVQDFESASLATTDLTTEMELPERVAIGAVLQTTVRTRLEVDVTRESWSTLERHVYQGAGVEEVVVRDWRDSHSVLVAGEFQQKRALQWRAAIGVVQDVVPDSTVNANFPDNDRFLYSFGVDYDKGRFSFELGYTYTQNRDRDVSDQEQALSPTDPDFLVPVGQDGLFETQRHTLGLGVTYQF